MVLFAAGGVGLAEYFDLAAGAMALADQGLDQFTLPVAGDTGNPQNLTRGNRQTQVAHSKRAPVAHDIQVADHQRRP